MELEVKYHEGTENLSIDTPVKNEYYIVLICYTGSSSIKVGFHQFELSPNTIAIIPPDVIFSISSVSDNLV